MRTVETCFRQIDKIKAVAVGADVAYVARSRINRLILSVIQIISAELNLPKPNRPGRMEVPESADSKIRNLVDVCNRLSSTAKTITQPSEPLDERWRSGWAVLLQEISELEEQLQLFYG